MRDLIRGQRLLEPAIAIVFFVLVALAEVGRHQVVAGTVRTEVFWWGALAVLAASIALSRTLPVVAMVTAAAAVVAQVLFPQAVLAPPYLYLGILVVIFGVSAGISKRLRATSFAFSIAIAAASMWLMSRASGLDRSGPVAQGVDAVVVNDIVLAIAAAILASAVWFLGFFARVWQEKARSDALLASTSADLRHAEADLLASAERDRIAQDVHDIMAHSLAVIIAQADGARYLASERPQAVSGSLENIAASARTSLTEVRMLIESLVADPIGHSNPTVADLDELVARMASTGLDISVQRFGDDAPLTPAQSLAVYRIVQEALTNALKHAGHGAAVRVTLDWRGPGLAIAIASSGGDEPVAPPSSRRGRGVYGMRERARLAGGWLTAGPDDDPNDYLVTAFVPTVAAVLP